MIRPDADLVSVIIPTYNRAELLLQAIDSVRRQTWPHVQIIVADDGSVDRTRELVAQMPDVCYVRQENRGQASARNLGLRYVEGAFVCCLDSDDLWDSDFLERSIQAIRTLKVDFVFSNWTGETADGARYASYFEEVYGWSDYQETELDSWRLLDPEQTRHIYIEACLSPSSALVLPRALLTQGWPEAFRIADDWGMLLDIVLARPCRVAVSTRPRWTKRVTGDNIYDQHDFMEVKRDFYIHDFRVILKRFGSLMRPKERALFYSRLAYHQAGMAKWELARKRIAPVPGLLFHTALCLLQAGIASPDVVLKRVRKTVSRKRAALPAVVASSATESH